jgi:hypothetical protein
LGSARNADSRAELARDGGLTTVTAEGEWTAERCGLDQLDLLTGHELKRRQIAQQFTVPVWNLLDSGLLARVECGQRPRRGVGRSRVGRGRGHGPITRRGGGHEFFTAAARNLQELGERAGVQRIVVVSIIGIDRFTGGYQAAKIVQERTHLSGPIPARILRAAQFHEFVPELINWGRNGEVAYLPKMRTQLVAARTVARALAELATNDADSATETNSIPEIAGPREENLVEAAQLLVAYRGDRLRIEAVSDPADPVLALYENGANLPGPKATLAGPTFEEWLREVYA